MQRLVRDGLDQRYGAYGECCGVCGCRPRSGTKEDGFMFLFCEDHRWTLEVRPWIPQTTVIPRLPRQAARAVLHAPTVTHALARSTLLAAGALDQGCWSSSSLAASRVRRTRRQGEAQTHRGARVYFRHLNARRPPMTPNDRPPSSGGNQWQFCKFTQHHHAQSCGPWV